MSGSEQGDLVTQCLAAPNPLCGRDCTPPTAGLPYCPAVVQPFGGTARL